MSKSFSDIAGRLLAMVREEKSVKDVLVMMEFDFNPESWRHWRAKLIELFELKTFQKVDSEGKERIVYNKKQKLWLIQDV